MEGFSAYRVMWIMVFFDLPTETKRQRKAYATFRKRLVSDGFTMFQFSIYLRHCASADNAKVHMQRVRAIMPEYGHVGMMLVTDKQFGEMELYYGKCAQTLQQPVQQLELF